MKNILILLTTILISGAVWAQKDVKYTAEDKSILSAIFEKLEDQRNKPVSELVVLVGKEFLGTPYVAHTLEVDKEQLVINLRELDCTTYAENCLAIARCIKSGNTTFDNFTNQLQKIRYRDGIIDGYPSRIHYFSDWIYENDKNGYVKDVSKPISNIQYPLEVNFMSKHPSSYKQLEGNTAFIEKMQTKEKEISSRKMYFIPKEEIKSFEPKLKEGDIIGLTTSVAGLDVTHVGILLRINGRIHLMHASSKAEEVVISENTLEDYLKNSLSATGIMVTRPM